ncbi:MAG: alpha/beta hydrolase [Candidatus Woykebacteria bacterium]
MQRSQVSVDGCLVSYLTAGDPTNPAAMIIHGWSAQASLFELVGELLSNSFFVIIPDQPGHGKSDALVLADLGRFAEIVVGIIDHLGATKVRLVGHSMGGSVAAEVARHYPERVAKLVLVDTAGGRVRRSTFGWLNVGRQKTWRSFRKGQRRQAAKVVLSFLANHLKHPTWMLRTFQMTVRCNLLEVLPNLQTEVAVLWAENDEYFPWEPICEALGVEPRIIKDTGHDWLILNPPRAAIEILMALMATEA